MQVKRCVEVLGGALLQEMTLLGRSRELAEFGSSSVIANNVLSALQKVEMPNILKTAIMIRTRDSENNSNILGILPFLGTARSSLYDQTL